MKKNKSLFDHLNQITKYKTKNYWSTLDSIDKKSWSNYMINRFLSMNISWCNIISYVQKYNLEPKIYYELLNGLIPRTNVFLRYIKKNKKDLDNNTINIISKYFECSNKEAEEYVDILNKKQIENIIKSYGVNK